MLSSVCGVMKRKDAERLIGENISTNRWRKANQFRKLYGAGIPKVEDNVVINYWKELRIDKYKRLLNG